MGSLGSSPAHNVYIITLVALASLHLILKSGLRLCVAGCVAAFGLGWPPCYFALLSQRSEILRSEQ